MVPLATDDQRAFRQERLSLLVGAMTALLTTFLVFGALIATFVIPDFDPTSPIVLWGWVMHAAAIAVTSLSWLALRGPPRSDVVLDVVDFGAPLGTLALVGAAVAIRAPYEQGRGDLVMMTGMLALLTMRAVVVPSSPRRTLLLGIAAMSMMPVLVMFILDRDPGFAHVSTRMILAFDGVWAVVTVWISTFASSVIFGLRSRVAEVLRLGPYVLGEKLGEGGMGTVYRAQHVLLKRDTAIKLLPADKAGHAAIARFEREVQHTSRLTHPNTVTIFDYGRTPQGTFYYAMEYLEGIDLQRLVDTIGPQSAPRTARLMEQIAMALAEAHEIGLVHRDVKPANVMLCKRGGMTDVVKVVDFGLVKEVEGLGNPALSAVNVLVGTPLYMPPEHIRSGTAMDARGDLYALGAVGYFLLTGSPPFPGKTILDVATQALHDAPKSPSERLGAPVQPALEALIIECLAKSPEARPSSARALVKRLRAIDMPRWTDDESDAWWQVNAARVRGAPGARA